MSATSLIDSPRRNRVYVDVRLGEPADEYLDFRKCHIYGAVHAQIRHVFASKPTELTGNLPLPHIAELVPSNDDQTMILPRNHVFASPSAAAAVLLGRPSNGRLEWRVRSTRVTYADWQASLLEGAGP